MCHHYESTPEWEVLWRKELEADRDDDERESAVEEAATAPAPTVDD